MMQCRKFDGKNMTSYISAIVLFALSLTYYYIFANDIKCQKFDLENEGYGQGVKKLDWQHSTGNDLCYIQLVVSEFYLLGNNNLRKHDIYTHTHTHTNTHT